MDPPNLETYKNAYKSNNKLYQNNLENLETIQIQLGFFNHTE